MTDSNSFCGVGNFPMLIPYSDVVNMVNSAKKVDDLEARFRKLETQHEQMRSMYFELLEKFGELRKLV